MTINLPPNMFCGELNKNEWNVREILEKMKKIYLNKIGYDFISIPDKEVQEWILHNIES